MYVLFYAFSIGFGIGLTSSPMCYLYGWQCVGEFMGKLQHLLWQVCVCVCVRAPALGLCTRFPFGRWFDTVQAFTRPLPKSPHWICRGHSDNCMSVILLCQWEQYWSSAYINLSCGGRAVGPQEAEILLKGFHHPWREYRMSTPYCRTFQDITANIHIHYRS